MGGELPGAGRVEAGGGAVLPRAGGLQAQGPRQGLPSAAGGGRVIRSVEFTHLDIDTVGEYAIFGVGLYYYTVLLLFKNTYVGYALVKTPFLHIVY